MRQERDEEHVMEWLSSVLPVVGTLGGALVGGWLTILADKHRSRREWGLRRRELLIEGYTAWTVEMESFLDSYANRRPSSRPRDPLCERRLFLLDSDPLARRLIQDIGRSIPEEGTEEFGNLEMEAHSTPEWDWPPFRTRMNQLLEHLSNRFGDEK